MLAAMAEVPRERFVPPETADRAYRDGALPIGEGQTISQPWIVARMTELLELEGPERVLEVGTGSGYGAAVLAPLLRRTWSPSSACRRSRPRRRARRSRTSGYATSRCAIGDGTAGVPDRAPFDAIVVTAAAAGSEPPAGAARPAGAGRAAGVPVERDGDEHLVRMRDGVEESVAPVRFVPLRRGRAREARVLGRRRRRSAGPRTSARWPCVSPARGVLALPKGHPDDGETLEQAATREVREETGLTAEPVEQARRRALLVHARRRARAQDRHLLPVRATSRATSPTTTTRWSRPRWVPLADAPAAAVLQGRARDGREGARSGGDSSLPRLVFVLNFYSPVFVDQLKRGRKTATIRLGDKATQVPQGRGRAGHRRLPALAARAHLRGRDRRRRGQAASTSSPRATSSTTTPSSAAWTRPSTSSSRSTAARSSRGRRRHGRALLARSRTARRRSPSACSPGPAPELAPVTVWPRAFGTLVARVPNEYPQTPVLDGGLRIA